MSNDLRGEVWRRAFAPPDTREIWEWARDEGELPGGSYAVSGRFDASLVPWVKEPMRALRQHHVRTVTNMWGVQLVKTLVGELWLLWLIANSPGPTQWVQPDDQEAKEHCEERFLALLECFPSVHRYFQPDRHKKKTTAIFFSHMWLRMEGANVKGNAQRKSVMNQFCSEIWQADKWKPGTLAEFASRQTQFTFNSKRYIESQPGMASWLNSDDMHRTFLDGTQEMWHVHCLSCGRAQVMKWSGVREDGSRFGLLWDSNEKTRRETNSEDPNQIWNWLELKNSIRYVCEHCGHAHFDEPLTRRRLADGGCYIRQNDNADGTHRSFGGVSQLVAPNLSWFASQIGGVKNFLFARAKAKAGDERPQREFFQKVMAEPYDPEKFTTAERLPILSTIEVSGGKFWEKQDKIFMTIDKQLGHYWALVEAWSNNGERCVVFADRVDTLQELRAKQLEFGVPDECTFMDAGNWRTEVFGECARHGHFAKLRGRDFWFCWWALLGRDAPSFTRTIRGADGQAKRISLPYSDPPAQGDPLLGAHSDDVKRMELAGKKCLVVEWSNPTIKDVTLAFRRKLETASGAYVAPGVAPHFGRQIYSEEKRLIERRAGGKDWKWVRVGGRANHLWDCWNMSTVAACMANLLPSFSASPQP